MLRTAVGAIFWLSAATLLIGLGRRSAVWRTGRSVDVRWLGLFAIPKRYLVDLHHVVAREPFVARAHAAVAGGAVLAIVIVGLNYGLRLDAVWLDALLLAAAVAMAGGAVAMAWRRRAPVPTRLSRGPWSRLPGTLLAGAVGLGCVGLVAVTQAPVAAWFAALIAAALLAGAAELALGIGAGGPMKHAVAGLLHLGLHPRPERFGDGRGATALKPISLDAVDLGVAKPSDFAWNRLLSFDACVQCGKCEAVCPAFAAGQPLNPKKLIQDLVAGMAARTDAAYAGSPHPGRPVGAHDGAPDAGIVPGLIDPDTLWACTTCRACVQECPMLIEHVDAVVDLRRHATLVGGTVPNKGAEALDQLRETDTVGGHALAARHHWAVDLNVPVVPDGGEVDCLILVGEGGYDLRHQRTLRAFVRTLHAARLDIATLGAEETDCGDLARRLGDEAGFQRLAAQLIGTLQTRRFRRIVSTDPHLVHSLRNEYPAFGGHYTVLHHTQLLADLFADGTLQARGPAVPQAPITFHDPCYLGRYQGEFDAPRSVLRHIGIRVVEMPRSRERSRCCGWGGGAAFTDIPGARRIPDMRVADGLESGAAVMAVACPNCTTMLESVVGPRPVIVDVAELVADAVGVA